MKQPCATCGYQNPTDSTFCIRCGSNVEAMQASQQSSASAALQSLSAPGNTGNFGNAGYQASPTQGYQAQGAQAQSMASSAPVQMGSTSGTAGGQTAPHAFAGRGYLLKHYAWLLPGEYLNAANLRSAILDLLRLRNFQLLKVDTEKLRETGYWTEERDYITMQRGVTTVLVYVAPAGHDLYISRATTVQLSFDPVRIVLLACILGEVFLGPTIIEGIATNAAVSAIGNPSSVVGPAVLVGVLALLYIPAITALLIFLVASIKYWLTERDFWVYLRRNYLHDFEIDDVKLLEQATDETVHAAGEQLKVDVTKITPPAQGDQARRRVRAL